MRLRSEEDLQDAGKAANEIPLTSGIFPKSIAVVVFARFLANHFPKFYNDANLCDKRSIRKFGEQTNVYKSLESTSRSRAIQLPVKKKEKEKNGFRGS